MEEKEGENKKDTLQLSDNDYIKLKEKQFKEAAAAKQIKNDLNWTMIWSEIISGLFLGLTQSQVDIYIADFKYNLYQMEILKFAQFSDLTSERFISLANPELTKDEMLRLLFYSKDAESFEGAKASVKSLIDEMAALKNEMQQNKMVDDEKYKKRAEDLERQIEGLNETINKLQQENNKLQNKIKSKEEIPDTPAEPPEEKEGKLSGSLFKKKKKQEAPKTKQPLPEDFDLSEYIINAGLSASQLELINFAIRNKIDESMIKQFIDNNIPAEQLKSIIEVIITKRAVEEKEA